MASLVGAILFLRPFTLPIFHSPFPTSISHFHLPLSFTTPQVATLCPLPYGCYPLPDTLWLRVCTPSGQCQVPLLPEPLPDGAPLQCPGQQQLRHSAPASNSSATAPRQQQLRYGALASNKPHPAEKSTPVWLAIWRTWAGFANSQHRDAAFATPDSICAHSSLLQH